MRKLIINADDLGLTPGCTAGIARAMTAGVVTDTTLLVNTEHAPAAVATLRALGIDRAGLHLNLTYGSPVLTAATVPSLVGDDGRFRRRAAVALAVADPAEAERELRAQVAQFAATGLTLTHLDSHHHIHGYPELLDIVMTLAHELNTPLRQTSPAVKDRLTSAGIATPDHFSTTFYGDGVSLGALAVIIGGYDAGVLEIMCHPAQSDQLTYAVSSYNAAREKEFAVLTASATRELIWANDIELVSYADLWG